MNVVGQLQMAKHDGSPSQGAMCTDLSAASHPYAAGHGRVRTNAYVVSDLDQVVEFDAITNDRVIQCTTIDAGIGANFNVIANLDTAKLLDFFPSSLMRCESESICADHDARMHQTTLTQHTVFSNRDS